MNKVLFKANLKNNWLILLFITGMMLMYTTIAIGMFSPESAESLEGMLKMLPEAMIKGFGFEGIGTELTAYLGSYLYGFIYLTFPIIYIVVVSQNVIVKHVDSGSMAYLLTTPNTRKSIALTQSSFLVSTLFLILLINVMTGILMSITMFPGHLQIGPYIALNIATFGTLYLIASFDFFLSCFFNDSKKMLSIGASIPILFIALKMLSALGEELAFLKYFTLFSLLDVNRILGSGSFTVTISAITLLFGTGIFYGSIVLFDKKSLNI
ncbi:MAG: hypothetical protein JXR88_03170 [Clostridia bacterium]|nr:hypothetical protein [Clostridia bacterium]